MNLCNQAIIFCSIVNPSPILIWRWRTFWSVPACGCIEFIPHLQDPQDNWRTSSRSYCWFEPMGRKVRKVLVYILSFSPPRTPTQRYNPFRFRWFHWGLWISVSWFMREGVTVIRWFPCFKFSNCRGWYSPKFY